MDLFLQQGEFYSMSEWLDIHDKKPYNDEPVYYYFDVFDKVYYGYYYEDDMSFFYNAPHGTYKQNTFYGRSGFLGDDVTYWMPREDTEPILYPDKPNKELLNV
jgi:hypothetical protein